jgi:hypothetical protein
MKKLTAIILAGASFCGGVYLADEVKSLRTAFHERAAEGFHQRPYDLRVVTRKNQGGLEAYLMDSRTNEYRKIGYDLRTKREKPNRIKGFLAIYKIINMF